MLLSLRQYLNNNSIVMLLITLQLIAPTHASVISDCATVALDTTEYIPNTNTACNTRYPYIYCNGEASAYCTQDECLEEYQCESVEMNELLEEDEASTTTTVPAVTTAESTIVLPTTTIVKSTTTTTTTTTTTADTTTTTVVPSMTTATTAAALVTITAVAQNVRNLCRAGVYSTYPYAGNCRYYYRCTNGYFLLQTCGYLLAFDAYDGYCKRTKEARCLSRLLSIQF